MAFGDKATTIKRLRAGATKRFDGDGMLKANGVHIATCAPGTVTETRAVLRTSPAAARAEAKFILATDGDTFDLGRSSGSDWDRRVIGNEARSVALVASALMMSDAVETMTDIINANGAGSPLGVQVSRKSSAV